jgi:hypothetical protein
MRGKGRSAPLRAEARKSALARLAPALQGGPAGGFFSMNLNLKKTTALGLLFGLGVIAASCSRSRESLTPAAGMAERLSPADAAEEIAQARCEREQRCNNIGAESEFQSRDHCMNVIRPDTGHMLADEGCEHGVSRRDLDECLYEIQTERCSGVARMFDRLDRFMQCRAGDLCLDD